MLKALLKKEWIQLRSLRWVGVALGLILPLALLAGAEAGQHGWSALGTRISSYSTETLMLEIAPVLLVGTWGLLALLIGGQTYAGDRAAGTESFLLERPVPRGRVWRARLLAVLATTALLMLVHLGLWALLTHLLADPEPAAWRAALRVFGYGGPSIALASLLAAVGAGTLVRSPIQAVLFGLLLLAIPVGLSGMLVGLFPLATYRNVPVGGLVPAILFAGYLSASFFSACRGEPAGRGRWKRGLASLGLSLLLLPALVCTTAPLAMRLEAGRFEHVMGIAASRTGNAAVALSGDRGSGWIVDVEKKRKLRFLPPPSALAAWDADGSRLAVGHASSPLGRYRGRPRIDIFDDGGSRIRTLTGETGQDYFGPLYWSGEHVVVPFFEPGGSGGLTIASTRSGEQRTLKIQQSPYRWRLLGPLDDGSLYLLRLSDRGTVVLQRVDPVRGELDPQSLLEEEGFENLADEVKVGYFYAHELSPGGRYLLRPGGRVLDLRTGNERVVPGLGSGVWLDDDRRLWFDPTREGGQLVLGPPFGPTRVLRSWNEKSVALTASPDRGRVLVRVWDPERIDESARTTYWQGQWIPLEVEPSDLWIFEVAGERWVDARDVLDIPSGTRIATWAGPSTLAYSGPGFLSFQDVAPGAERHDVIGRP